MNDSVKNKDLFYLVHPDRLGSYTHITNANKQVIRNLHFDPWGNVKSDTNWLTFDSTTLSGNLAGTFRFSRGFTGHEHYADLKIINMNGRLYDPVIARFFSPDNFVQAPEFTQSYHRYSYCLNNPLQWVDPSGELFGDYFDQYGKYLGSDGIDDGNVYIILNKNISWVLNNCSYQSDEHGVVFFDKYASNYASRPSEMSLSEDAIFKIVEHYNCTTLPLEKGDKTKDELLTTRTLEIDINNDGKIDLYKQKLLCNTMAWINNILSLDNYYNIRSSYDHESHHIETFIAMGGSAYVGVSNPVREINAINYQKNQINYQKTSEVFKKGIDLYYLEMLKQLK